MKRDLERLRKVGELLAADLRHASGDAWELAVEDGPTLVVTDGHRAERVLLDDEVDLDAWPEEAWSETYREHTLDDEASEALAAELFEVLRLWDVAFAPCLEHRSALVDVCSMTWTCPGPPAHDLAQVGSLSI